MPVEVHHLKGVDAWLRCDHDHTRLHEATGTVRLARLPQNVGDEAVDGAAWADAWVGAVVPPTPEGTCEGDEPDWELGDRTEGVLVARRGQWRPLEIEPAGLRTWVADVCDRRWALRADGAVARALSEDGDPALDVPLPLVARWLAVGEAGLWAADASTLWFGPWDQPWLSVELPPGAEMLGVAAYGSVTAALLRLPSGPALVRLSRATASSPFPIDAAQPSALAVGPQGRAWVLTPLGSPPRRTRIEVYGWGDFTVGHESTYEIGRFDGRGLAFVGTDVWGSTPTGWVKGYRIAARVQTTGRVETFALDSARFGCTWHRVFVDVCLPEGTRVSVAARTADTVPTTIAAGDLRPRLPQGATTGLQPPTVLGSSTEDDVEGWVDVGVLDSQALYVDRARPPRGALPALDPLPRGETTPSGATRTLEGLFKNEPGRYLWLRITLYGRRTASPLVAGVRALAPRPSMLAFLPAWWRADPDSKRMDELLALFEAPLSRIEDRVEALPALFDPLATPPEALDWLASFLGLAYEPQLPERVRRTLLAEIAVLYRQRGTNPGLERLCTIIAEAPVRIVEAFRTRAGTGSVLGDGAVMGGTLQLGASLDPQVRDDTGGNDDDTRAWYRQFAHRFQVVVHRPCTPWIEGILERAIECHKPAHTVHTVCFADALQVGAAMVGVTTAPGPAPGTATAVVDVSILGAATLSRALPPLPRPPVPRPPEEPS